MWLEIKCIVYDNPVSVNFRVYADGKYVSGYREIASLDVSWKHRMFPGGTEHDAEFDGEYEIKDGVLYVKCKYEGESNPTGQRSGGVLRGKAAKPYGGKPDVLSYVRRD